VLTLGTPVVSADGGAGGTAACNGRTGEGHDGQSVEGRQLELTYDGFVRCVDHTAPLLLAAVWKVNLHDAAQRAILLSGKVTLPVPIVHPKKNFNSGDAGFPVSEAP
jgi:hypothetical protein